MTLDLDRKCELLRSFHKLIFQRGWNFKDSQYRIWCRSYTIGDVYINQDYILVGRVNRWSQRSGSPSARRLPDRD